MLQQYSKVYKNSDNIADEGFTGWLQRKIYIYIFQASFQKLDFKEVDSLGKEVAALVEKYNLKDVNLDAMVIPKQQLADDNKYHQSPSFAKNR